MNRLKQHSLWIIISLSIGVITAPAWGQEPPAQQPIFDDTLLLNGFAKNYSEESLETIQARIVDDTLTSYQMAAAVRVFREKYSKEVFSKEKRNIERLLLRRLAKEDSPFIEIEILHTLCLLDRYKYFGSVVPVLFQKLDHYNTAANELAYAALNNIIETSSNRPREASIVFNTLRKILFLSRKRLIDVTEPSPRLTQKLKLLRWAIKILGSQELKRLPPEVINLL